MRISKKELELTRAAESAQSSSNRYLEERDNALRELEERELRISSLVERVTSLNMHLRESELRRRELYFALESANKKLSCADMSIVPFPDDVAF